MTKKGWKRDSRHSVCKRTLRFDLNYNDVIREIKNNYQISESECILLDTNDKCVEIPDFTAAKYIEKFKHYVGVTRIYLGIQAALSL